VFQHQLRLLDDAEAGERGFTQGQAAANVETAWYAHRLPRAVGEGEAPVAFRTAGNCVFGAIAAVKAAAPKIRQGGSIVLTGGIAGARPQKGWTLGASICGAMEGFTRALAVELAPIRVNIVSPGFVRTPLWSNVPEIEREAMYRQVGARLLVGRVGEADDIAQTYLYLMNNGFATGQTIVIDGGGILV
jgi:NAD(P)-dependent dehydrogenase (short-subunit alcohol dehydrogenase family)